MVGAAPKGGSFPRASINTAATRHIICAACQIQNAVFWSKRASGEKISTRNGVLLQ